jgi:hypothetical protein
MQRNQLKPVRSFEQRLADEAQRLRKEAKGTPPGIERERLIRRARQAETASQWTRSPSLQPPR